MMPGSEFVSFGTLGLLPTFALERGFNTQQSFIVIAVANAYVLFFSDNPFHLGLFALYPLSL
jgi:hypothetical protein